MATGLVKKGPAPLAKAQTNIAPKHEMQIAKAQAQAISEIQSAITIAKSMPRDMEEVRSRIERSVTRPKMAEAAVYHRRQGYKTDEKTGQKIVDKDGKWVPNIISGPSAPLARELARCMGNMIHGTEVVRDDSEQRIIRSFAWDLETNTKVVKEDIVQKTIERSKVFPGQEVIGERMNTQNQIVFIVRPTEDELRLSINRRAAFAERNAILEIIPRDIADEAEMLAKNAMAESVAQLPPDERLREIKGLEIAFGHLGVTREMLEKYLGVPIANWTPEDIATLISLGRDLKDPDSGISIETEFGEISPKSEVRSPKSPRKVETATFTPKAAESANRGHGEDNLSLLVEAETEDENLGEEAFS